VTWSAVTCSPVNWSAVTWSAVSRPNYCRSVHLTWFLTTYSVFDSSSVPSSLDVISAGIGRAIGFSVTKGSEAGFSFVPSVTMEMVRP
jgi:hypothetical protein